MSGSASIRWSPHSTPDRQRFLRISSRDPREHELSLFNIAHVKNGGKEVKVELVAKHSKVPYVRCFDWSPVDEDLVSVGQTSGEALLLRISSNVTIPLGVRQQRACNGLSFNCTGQLLATGLDKVRSDFCLNIWDVNQRLGERVIPGGGGGGGGMRDGGRPLRQLASSETISSVCFVRDDVNVLIAGAATKWIRVFDLRESPSNTTNSCFSRCTMGITLDLDPNYFASYSEESTVAVWDRRFIRQFPSSGEPALNFVRPTDDHGRAGGGTTLLRYSRTKEGTFAVLNASGGLRSYDTAKISDQDPYPVSSLGLYGTAAAAATVASAVAEPHRPRGGWRDSAASLLDGARNGGGLGTRTPNPRSDGETLFVTRISDIVHAKPRGSERQIVSFDWMSDPHGASRGEVLRALCLRLDGSMGVLSLSGSSTSLAWGSRNGLSFTHGRGLGVLPSPDAAADRGEAVLGNPASRERPVDHDEGLDSPSGSPRMRLGMHETRRSERSNSVVRPEDFLFEPAEVLRNDICVVMRKRVEGGYEMDCTKNAQLTEDVYLKDMWMWLQGAWESARNNGMVSGLLDLSYMGVLGIWHGGSGQTQQSRLTATRAPTTSDWTDAVGDINKKCGRARFKGNTQFPEQRQLALAICGWDFSTQSLDQEMTRLEKGGQYAKAAGWALFHGDIERSIRSLSQGGQQMKLMSTAVAGYYSHAQLALDSSHSPQNSASGNVWKELCRDMAVELDDPYLRAIFAYVSNGDWKDVLDDVGLPIRERLGIALRWLKDEELTNYLEDLTRKVVGDGDLDGIVVTGISEKAISLLQVYVNRTGDVQTAALVACFAVPRYFEDDRVGYWVESYRQLLNSWRLFHARARFDVSRGKISRNRSGVMTIDGVQRQVYVRCANCNKSVSHTTLHSAVTPRERQIQTALGTATKATVCPHCKKSLPRCAVCLLNLGTIYYKRANQDGKSADPDGDYDRWFNFCLSCNHGMHAGHAREWFGKHRACPVPDCDCQCKV